MIRTEKIRIGALRTAKKVLKKIKKGPLWKPDVVIGISRSGGIWDGWLTGNLEAKPLLVVDVSYQQSPTERRIEFPVEKQVWLLVKSSKRTAPLTRKIILD